MVQELIARCRGLPFSCTEKQLRDWFTDKDIESVCLPLGRDGRPSGEGYITFTSQDAYEAALKKDRDHMGSRYIEVFAGTQRDLDIATRYKERRDRPSSDRRGPRDTQIPQGDYVVRLRGLPFGVSHDEIKKFFEPLEIDGMVIPLDVRGHSNAGEAFVVFRDRASAEKALEKDRQNMQHRYIEVFRSSQEEMNRSAGGYGGGGRGGPVRGGGDDYYGGRDSYPRSRPSPYDRADSRRDPYGGYGGAAAPPFRYAGYEGYDAPPADPYGGGYGRGGAGPRDPYGYDKDAYGDYAGGYGAPRKGPPGGYGGYGGDSYGTPPVGYGASYGRAGDPYGEAAPRGYPDPEDYYAGGRGAPAAESWRAGPPQAERTRAMDRGAGYDRPERGGARGPASGGAPGGAGRRFILKMRGIPFNSTEYDIYEFFGSANRPTFVEVLSEPGGRPAGEARVEFPTRAAYDEALQKDKQYLGSRYVELFPDTGRY